MSVPFRFSLIFTALIFVLLMDLGWIVNAVAIGAAIWLIATTDTDSEDLRP